MKIDSKLKKSITYWNEVKPDVLDITLSWRPSQEIKQEIQAKYEKIILELEKSREITSYINGLQLDITIEEVICESIKNIVKISTRLELSWVKEEKLLNATLFHSIQSLKKSKARGVKSKNTSLNLAKRSHIIEWFIIETLSKKEIFGVEQIPQGKTFSEFFSNSNITTVCIRDNNPEEKLKTILEKAIEYELLKQWEKLNNDDILFCLDQIKHPENT